MRDPPAWFYPRILVGAGEMVTSSFCHRYNITHVINCAFPEDSPIWFRQAYPTRYACLGALDSIHVDILEWYPAFEEVLGRFLRDPACGVVFIHCQCGINRSAFLTLTYVCRRFHQEYDVAMKQAHDQRPCMFTNPVFMKLTKEFINGRLQGAEGS